MTVGIEPDPREKDRQAVSEEGIRIGYMNEGNQENKKDHKDSGADMLANARRLAMRQ
jgi:hypothetical protein